MLVIYVYKIAKAQFSKETKQTFWADKKVGELGYGGKNALLFHPKKF